MILPRSLCTLPNGWLAFELSVLRRLKFRSVAIPFVNEPVLGVYLKRWGVQVAAADEAQWAWIKAIAYIENNAEQLREADVNVILEDAYVPGYKLNNQALSKWFNETDAWWFDNMRERVERVGTPDARAIALSLVMTVGDYALSFDEQTREFRQPLSTVFRRVWKTQPPPVNNSHQNMSVNQQAREFIAEQHTDLLFLRLPCPINMQERNRLETWREEWIRGGDGFWESMKRTQAGRLGAHIETRRQYLSLVEDLLQRASHLPTWAIAHVEDGFIPTSELVETINRVRKVETIYTKDFSELTGVRATIIVC